MPIFPGYVFCRLEVENRFPLLTIPGVVHVVGVGRVPLPLDDREVRALQTAIHAEAKLEPCPFLEGGERVRVGNGPLDGVEGIRVASGEGCRVALSLTVLKRSVAVEIHPEWLTPAAAASRPDRYTQEC